MVFRSQLLQLNGSLGIVINIPLGAYWFVYPVESVLNYIQQNHYVHPLPKNEQKTGLPRCLLILFKWGFDHSHTPASRRRREVVLYMPDWFRRYLSQKTNWGIELCKGKRLNSPAINRNIHLLCIAPMNTKYYLSTKKSMLALNLNLKTQNVDVLCWTFL